MDRIIRLSFITEYLTLKKKTTAKELASKLNVSQKTIYRDIELLSSMEVPIYVQPGRNGGIHILESYVISEKLISDQEQLGILAALKSVEATGASDNNLLSTKLSSIFKKETTSSFNIDFSGWGKEVEKEKLDMISHSQNTRKELLFSYTNTNGETSERRVIVTDLSFKKNAWYFNAYCLDKKESRIFKLSRADEIKLGEIYDIGLLEIANTSQNNQMKFLDLTIKVQKNSLIRVQEDLKIKKVTTIDSNNVLIETAQPEGEWLIHYLLSFGSSIEVVSPKFIRDNMIKEIELMTNIY